MIIEVAQIHIPCQPLVANRLTLITTAEKNFKPCNRESEEGRALSRRSKVTVGVETRAKSSKVEGSNVALQSPKSEVLSNKPLNAERR